MSTEAFSSQGDPLHRRRYRRRQVGTSRLRSSDSLLTLSVGTSIAGLEAMTVKELKDLLKSCNLNERGLLTKLKRKHDLVSYLHRNLASENPRKDESGQGLTGKVPLQFLKTRKDSTGSDARREARITPAQSVKQPLSMPPLDDGGMDNSDDMVKESAYLTSLAEATMADTKPDQTALRTWIQTLYPPLRGGFKPDDHNLTMSEQDGYRLIWDEERREHVDIRQKYHPMLQGSHKDGDMELITLGTASCIPSYTRGVMCTALRFNFKTSNRVVSFSDTGYEAEQGFPGGTWLFDCGEGTQLQIQKNSKIRPTKINKIFVTHAHGDHSFGLPGLLCFLGTEKSSRQQPLVEIYGPEGLRMWLRVAIRYSVSRIVPNYVVHELMDVPMAPEWKMNPNTNRWFKIPLKNALKGEQIWDSTSRKKNPESWENLCDSVPLDPSRDFGELEGGRNIYPQYDHPLCRAGAPIWLVEDQNAEVKVWAAPMSHGVPCVGYVVEELDRPGRLRNEYVEPIVKRNIPALIEAGHAVPMKLMAFLKNLKPGEAYTFPDGTEVTHESAMDPPRPGRKIAICGDSCNSRAIEGIAANADVLVHEATNTYLPGVNSEEHTLEQVIRDANVHGHSTPHMTAWFARRIQARKLVMNHFSSRYKGNPCFESIAVMSRIEMQAMMRGQYQHSDVLAAWDGMFYSIPKADESVE